jgi:soluble lytic murein transglycosylase-like protein
MRRKQASHLFIAVFAVLCLGSVSANADMYRCVDRSGSVSFTNAPASGNCSLLGENWGSSSFARPDSGDADTFSGYYSVGSQRYDRHIRRTCMRYGVDPSLVKAVIRAESDFDSNAISSRGAQGLMQLMPGTARDLNVANPFDPRQNIDGGVRYLRMILDLFNGNLPLSLAAYNAGPNLVKRYRRIPAIPETIEYVKRVLRYYSEYRRGSVQRISMPSTEQDGNILSSN